MTSAPGAGPAAASSPPSAPPVSSAERSDRPVTAVADSGRPASTPAETAARDRVAVIVAHGMGQQVPFETLEGIADALRDAEQRRCRPEPTVHTRFVRLGDQVLPRAVLTLTTTGGDPREVHLFEVYWAPLTEGKATLRETIGFLIGAGVRGLFRTRFDRLMFNAWYRFRIGRRVVLEFSAALVTLLALAASNAVLLAVAASAVVTGGRGGWPTRGLLGELSCDLATLAAVGLTGVVLGVGIPAAIRRKRNGRYPRLPAALRFAFWGLIAIALLAAVAAGLDMTLRAAFGLAGRPYWAWPPAWAARFVGRATGAAPMAPSTMAPLGAAWGLALVATYCVRHLMLQYVGDVAVYVSPSTVNRFQDTREAIQRIGLGVMRAVYDAKDSQGFVYPNVVVAGHSLGSVIAYDVLNKLLIEDTLAPEPARVAERTALFLTFGSPLDKIAYVFRTQRPADRSVRESLAEARQPMITSYAQRPRRWINIHSPDDWIGASLDFFDTESPDPERRVCNVIDREATTPLLAHAEHWSGYAMSELLYRGVIGDLPACEELQALVDRGPIRSPSARPASRPAARRAKPSRSAQPPHGAGRRVSG